MKSIKHLEKMRCAGFLLMVLCLACQSQSDERTASATTAALQQPTANPLNSPALPEAAALTTPQPPSGPIPKDLQFKTLQNPDGTWGYDLLGDGRLMIHQTNIPALPGNAGFATAEQAARVAQAALQKIKNGQSLPTLSVEEVRQLMSN